MDVQRYLAALIDHLKAVFGPRLLYVGLQGSYLRGEATEHSDIDVMLVLDTLSLEDLETYRDILQALGHADRACGFVCGAQELRAWNPLEICQLTHTTRDLYGSLAPLVPAWTREDERTYVALGLNNLYHELCHRYVHAPRQQALNALPSIAKQVFFLVQNLHYLRTGEFLPTKAALLDALSSPDREALHTAMDLQAGASGLDREAAYRQLFAWCQRAAAHPELR